TTRPFAVLLFWPAHTHPPMSAVQGSSSTSSYKFSASPLFLLACARQGQGCQAALREALLELHTGSTLHNHTSGTSTVFLEVGNCAGEIVDPRYQCDGAT
ncbi:hypothetical protein B0H14DRAFT_2835135, partial [Mycena olivaceomarginata]